MPFLVYRNFNGRAHTQVTWGRVSSGYLSLPIIAQREILEDEATLPMATLKAKYPLVNGVIQEADSDSNNLVKGLFQLSQPKGKAP